MTAELKQAAQIALLALEYHTQQTRPITQTEEAIKVLMEALAAHRSQAPAETHGELTDEQIDALMPPPAEASEPIMKAPGYRSAQRGEYEHVGDTPDYWTRDQVRAVVRAALADVQPKGTALELTCSHANRSYCALYDPKASQHRPSAEWYRAKIAETEGLDDNLPCGGLATQALSPAPEAVLLNGVLLEPLTEEQVFRALKAAGPINGATVRTLARYWQTHPLVAKAQAPAPGAGARQAFEKWAAGEGLGTAKSAPNVYANSGSHMAWSGWEAGAAWARAQAPGSAPIDMVLHCPACGLQHVDAPEDADCDGEVVRSFGWSNPPHRSHLCHGCGHIWRPADVPTNGVKAVLTKGKADSPIRSPAVQDGLTDEQRIDWLCEEAVYTCGQLSPLEITILLHYYSTVTDFRDGDFSAPTVRQAIDRFYKLEDLLAPTNGVGVLAAHGAAYAITDRGRAFVKALTQMPLPVCVWTIPSTSQEVQP